MAENYGGLRRNSEEQREGTGWEDLLKKGDEFLNYTPEDFFEKGLS